MKAMMIRVVSTDKGQTALKFALVAMAIFGFVVSADNSLAADQPTMPW